MTSNRSKERSVRDKSENVVRHEARVTKQMHTELKHQKPCVLWFTGLSGSGKSTTANVLELNLFRMGHHTHLLDGDNIRHGLNRDLDFSDEGRIENIRRIGEVAKLFVDAGLIVLTAFISPFRSDRRMVRELMREGEFIEIYVDTPLEVCEQRDPKGLYKKARSGKIQNFTGISHPYEEPEYPEIRIDTQSCTPDEAAQQIIVKLESLEVIGLKAKDAVD